MAIKNRGKLLQDIADGLRDLVLNESIRNRVALGDIEIVFHVGGDEYTFDLPSALNNIVNDTFWSDCGGICADPDCAEVKVL